ncbi:MAG TPA: GNAT family protein [Candidatus Limnocylindria bacterium]|jgi:RimJ/RimL family protein N-acetyltransferase
MNPDRVRLRDVVLADADLLEAWDTPVGQGEFNDFGMPRRPAPRETMAQGPLRNEENGQLIVELVADGTPIGTIGWHRGMYGPNPESAAWNIGISLIPEFRGMGYGTEAQRQVAAYLFETTGVNRVEASTDVENLPEQRSLEKAGYRREGVQRGAQYRAGRFHDLITYGRTRDDPP